MKQSTESKIWKTRGSQEKGEQKEREESVPANIVELPNHATLGLAPPQKLYMNQFLFS